MEGSEGRGGEVLSGWPLFDRFFQINSLKEKV